MKKSIYRMVLLSMVFTLSVCGLSGPKASETEEETAQGMMTESESLELPFAYEHDPRKNPEAMADIVENPEAVYGFSPDPESTRLGTFADYDWTDPVFVAQAQEERRAYHESLDTMTDILYQMRDEGASMEEMARAVSEERNRIRLASYDDDPEGLAAVKKSNLETYGHEEGPTPDELFEKYGSWTTVLQKAFGANMGMDACCGLYDEYYLLYIELGYVEDPGLSAETEEAVQNDFAAEEYVLDKVVVLSRHNIRSPLSAKGSVVVDLCAHDWFEWTSNPSELSLRGAVLETLMGQYFRLWLENEGLFPENYIPEDGAVRFYANGLQRTQATARYFSAGLLPVAVVPVECKVEYNEKDDTFLPLVFFLNDAYEQDALNEIYEIGGGEKLEGLRESLREAFQLIMDVTDMEDTEAYKTGEYGNLLEDDCVFSLEQGEEPKISGPLSMAVSLADALVLQYYEEPDEKKAAFGHDLTEEDWKTIGSVLKANLDIRFSTPLLAINESHLMLEELYSEMNEEDRKFTFLCGHDSTVSSVLSALGVQEYTLPGAIEPSTPIGVKLVFERWADPEDQAFYQVKLVYQSVDQLRAISPLSLENPPMIVPISFEDAKAEENGMIPEETLLGLFEEKIGSWYELEEIYGEEEMDDAA